MADLSILPDPSLLKLLSVEVDDALQLITATATTTASEAACPLCQQASHRVHSHYLRTLTDLPCCGQRVKWIIQVRRFRCLNPTCSRKLFSERLPTCAPAYARRTLRQGEALSEVACTLGGKVGEWIVGLMSMSISHDTLLRMIRRRQPEALATPRVLQGSAVVRMDAVRCLLTQRTSRFRCSCGSGCGDQLQSVIYLHMFQLQAAGIGKYREDSHEQDSFHQYSGKEVYSLSPPTTIKSS